MKKCSKCGKEFEGNCCPNCGTWAEEEKTCPKCGNKLKADANFCEWCGYSYKGAPDIKSQKESSSFKEKLSNLGVWLKKHLKIVIPVAVAVLLVIILACSIPACVKAKDNGTYYKLQGGELDKKTYFVIKSGKWSDEDGESGTYKKDGDKIIFYVEFFGATEEAASGTIKDGVLTIDEGGYNQVYISSDHKHKYGDWKVTTEVTCTTDGEETRQCACGVKETKTVKCAGRHIGEWTVEKEATCAEKGLRKMSCTVCKKDIEEDIDYADHNLSDWLSSGSNHYKKCSVCDKNFETEKHDNDDCCTVCGYPFEFELSSGTYTVKSYKKDNETVIIPESFNGISVTSIGYQAFNDCSSLISVIIPVSVISIGSSAFSGCSSLAEIKYIGDIKDWCKISGFSGLMPYGTGDRKLYIDNQEITGELVIPDSVISIGSNAFSGCAGLTSLTISEGVTSIGESAFSRCSNLTSITIANSVTSIGGYAFYDCPIETATIPALALSYIKKNSLKMIVITSGDSIGDYAFYGCSSLTSITIPNGVTSIGWRAFEDCSRLTSITFKGTKEEWNAIKKDGDWNSDTGKYVVHCTDGDISK